MVEPQCLNFRIIKTIFRVSEVLGILQYFVLFILKNRHVLKGVDACILWSYMVVKTKTPQ